MKIITSSQCRAGRALLGWSQPDLAKRARMNKQTISNFEAGKSTPSKTSLEKLETTLENGGVFFTERGGVEPTQETIRTYKGQRGFQSFMMDVFETCRDIGGDVFVTNVDENLFDKWAGDDFIFNTYLKNMQSLPEGQFKFHTIVSESDSYKAVNTYSEYRYIPKKYWSPVSTYIYGNKMANIIFSDDDVLVRVYDQKDLVEAQRKTALFIWNNAKSNSE